MEKLEIAHLAEELALVGHSISNKTVTRQSAGLTYCNKRTRMMQ